MIVRDVYVSDKEYFLEFLIRDLIKHGISYCFLKDDNELHFDNYIIRFHEKVNEIDNLNVLLTALMDIDSMERNDFLPVPEEMTVNDKKQYQKRNKRLIKQENRRYSKMINTRRRCFRLWIIIYQ